MYWQIWSLFHITSSKWINEYYYLIHDFRIVNNSGDKRKVWYDKTYSAGSQESTSPIRNFYRTLNGLEEDIYRELTPCEEMDLSDVEQESFDKCGNCYVCGGKFGMDKNILKNCEHCHKTG